MIYLDNNTFQQEIFIPRSSVKNDASPEYATKNELENAIENEVIRADEKYAAKTDLLPYATTGWVESQDFATKEWTDEQIQSAIASETERTEETYQKKSEMGIYSTTNEVENMIDDAVSGKMDTSAMSAYTPTSGFATINGSAITEGGNIVIEGGGSEYSAGSNINIDENNVISVTGITVPTSNTAFTNDAGYVTSGEVETQITGKNYATESWVQDNINIAIETETARTESTYAKIGDIPSLDGYATTGWVESQGYLTEHQDISGKLDSNVFTAYTANTQTELNNKQDISGMTAYATTAFTESTYLKEHQSLSAYSTTEQVQTLINTAKQEVENEIPDVSDFVTSAQVETQITDKGYLTGYTETDPVFQASAANGITSQDITNWNAKLDSSDLEPYYTSAQTNNAISDAVSGKADSSAVTAQISEVKAQIEAEIPSKVSDLQNDLNFASTGDVESMISGFTTSADVKTQIEGYNYINSGQAQTQIDNSISGKLDTDIFTTYTANTQTELNNKQDISGMTEYATTAFTENTYAKIGDIPTKTSDLTNDSGFITDAALSGYATEQYVDNSVSGKVDNSALTQYYTSAQTDTAISNAVSGKLDTSAITAYSTTKEVENMITAATNGLASEEWVESQGYLKEHQDISGKLDTSVFITYTANTQTELNNKQDVSGMTEYATTAFTESTYLKEHQSLSAYSTTEQMNQAIGSATAATTGWVESQGYLTEHQSLSAYTPTSGFSTINGSAITEGGNIVIEGGSSIKNYQPLQVEFDPYYSYFNVNEISPVGTQQFYMRIAFDTINGNSIIHPSDNDKVNWTIPTSTSALTNDSGYITTADTQNFVTSGDVETQIDNAVSGKQDTLVSGTNIKTINNQSLLGSGNIEIQGGSGGGSYTAGNNIDITNDVISVTGLATINGSAITEGGNIVIQGGSGGGSNIIELTQAEYDALTAYTEDAIYVITDSQAINMDNYVTTGALGSYYTSAETDTAISNAVSGKTDKVSVTASSSGYKFPTWNNQGCITGTYSTAYQASQSINGSSRTLYSTSSSSLPTIYAPTSAGSAGQPLLSNGSGAPVWGAYKFQFISQSQYDALATKDSTTIYFIVNEN